LAVLKNNILISWILVLNQIDLEKSDVRYSGSLLFQEIWQIKVINFFTK